MREPPYAVRWLCGLAGRVLFHVADLTYRFAFALGWHEPTLRVARRINRWSTLVRVWWRDA